MGSQTMILVLFLVASIHGSSGSVSHPQTALPPNIGDMSSVMMAVVPSTQPRNPSDHGSVKHTWPRTMAPIESLAPDGLVKAGQATTPINYQDHSSPLISPTPHEVKNPSNTTEAASPLHHDSYSLISPTTQEVAKVTHAPLTSLPSPSPMISHVPHEINKPLISTHAPMASHPLTSPIISPAPHQVKNNSSNTQAPIISPTRHEVKNNSNNAHAPMVSHSSFSPMVSHVPHEIYNPSNTTHAPLASRPLNSPIIRPSPHEIRNNPNNTQAPLISPTRHEAKNNSNNRHAPMTSHPSFSPKVSPISHEFKNLSNITHAPLPSNLIPPPKISPPRDLENPSNNTRAPSTSHLAPSPVVNPMPHNVKYPPNTTHAPSTSHASPSPLISPSSYSTKSPPYTEHAPISSHPHPPSTRIVYSPVSTPATSAHHNTTKERVVKPAPAPFSVLPPSSYHPVAGPVISPPPSHPPVPSKDRRTRHAPPFHVNGPSLSLIQAPISSKKHDRTPASPPTMIPRQNISPASVPSPSGSFSRKPWASSPKPSHPNSGPTHSPSHSYSASSPRKQRAPSPQPIWVLPPPPPNSDCNGFTCSAPLTNTPPGSPCDCVLPIKVALRLGIALYTFFPLVSELAEEIAEGVFLRQSQVRIMGANAASEDPEKTDVFINLVPLGKYFDSTTALLIYEKFWHKQVSIHPSFFGGYDILYVFYTGLPPSPPTAPSDINVNNGGYGNSNNARMIHPLGVDVSKRKEKRSGSLIAIIVLSSAIALVLIVGAAWLLLLKHRNHTRLPVSTSQTLLPTFAKSLVAGAGPTASGSRPNSTSASFSSSMTAYTGSAKTFGFVEIERATNKFDDARIIGEGGFGRVYQGTLEDGTMVAVKALKRDDQQGGREFLAEVEMLSRLHHRNLVKLIGICTEEIRCLVYELIPNGSVESHLHGVNKETFPLDWGSRLKVALGAARGLAYLHEDSSPCVIHRDFKSSNILLELDFTPKVSDFGLARTAMDEGNEHISTRVMGTFGYVAPEYAMTGHLLVKSDVYSYGVVLLELLTGRKPVDMSRPPGQENLVTWARPLLTSIDGLEMIVDPTLGADVPSDSVAKVAAIASMCVQPEVSNRPFMGEVVQALKLVCNESDEHRASRCSQEDLPSQGPPELRVGLGLGLEAESALSMSEIFSTSTRFTKEASESSRRHSSSGPLRMGRKGQFWQRVRGLSRGSMSDHGYALRFAMSSDRWS